MQGDLHESYRILEVELGAPLEDVKRAYRELVKVWHPDRFTHDPKLQIKAQEKLKAINLAYERICAGGSARRESKSDKPADSRSGAQTAAPPQSPRSATMPAKETPWGRRFAQAAMAVVLIVVVRAIFSTKDNPQPRSAGNQVAYFEPRPAAQAPLPSPVDAQRKIENHISAITPVEKQTAKGALSQSGPAIVTEDTSAPRSFFTVASSKNEVLAVQGTPDEFSDTVFTYPYGSKVFFQGGHVVSWKMSPTFPLKVKLLLHSVVEDRGFFTIGSTKDEVLAVQGTPDEFTDTVFTYPYGSRVFFKGDHVVSWKMSPTFPLHVKLLLTATTGNRGFSRWDRARTKCSPSKARQMNSPTPSSLILTAPKCSSKTVTSCHGR